MIWHDNALHFGAFTVNSILNRVTYTEAEIEAQQCTLSNTWEDNFLGILRKLQISYFSKTSLDGYLKLTSDISLKSVPHHGWKITRENWNISSRRLCLFRASSILTWKRQRSWKKRNSFIFNSYSFLIEYHISFYQQLLARVCLTKWEKFFEHVTVFQISRIVLATEQGINPSQ